MSKPNSGDTQYVVMFVLNDPNKLDDVLDAWHSEGIRGVTILESTGLFRRLSQTLGARYAYGFPRLFGGSYKGHFTLLAVVDGMPEVETCVREAEALVGDLDEPNTGMITAWPVAVTFGARPPASSDERSSEAEDGA